MFLLHVPSCFSYQFTIQCHLMCKWNKLDKRNANLKKSASKLFMVSWQSQGRGSLCYVCCQGSGKFQIFYALNAYGSRPSVSEKVGILSQPGGWGACVCVWSFAIPTFMKFLQKKCRICLGTDCLHLWCYSYCAFPRHIKVQHTFNGLISILFPN